MNHRLLSVAGVCGLTCLVPAPAKAVPPPPVDSRQVAFEADNVRFDARSGDLEVVGHVRVDEPPFHLSSDALRLRRALVGAQLDGQGRLAFCPCLGTPLAVRFSSATVAPPHDVVLRNPVLEVFGVPLAWAPVIWLRSTGRVGLLPPDIEWRGQDGVFLGTGVHVPWRNGDTERGIDLRAGGYVEGGFAAEASLHTAMTSTRIGWDRFHGDDGLSLSSSGSTASMESSDESSVAWHLDALRGARAVAATSDVARAAEPFDRASAQAEWQLGDWTLATGIRSVAPRGGDVLEPGVGGPVALVRRSGDLASVGAYDATVEAGQLAGAGLGATNFARGEGGLSLASRVGPLGGTLTLHGAGDLAAGPATTNVDGGAQVRGVLALPLAKRFDLPTADAPWVHTMEPRIEVAAAETRIDSPLVPPPRGVLLPNGGAWIAAVGWGNRLDRLGSPASVDVDAVLGEVGTSRDESTEMRVRASMRGPWAELETDFARTFASDPTSSGGAWISSARLGAASGLYLAGHVAERDGQDPILARALVDPTLEPTGGFLAEPGWTGGVRAGLPLGSRVTARAGVDADLDAKDLVAETGSIELHDPCNCVVVRASGSRRIGRSGVDVWLSVDVPMSNR